MKKFLFIPLLFLALVGLVSNCDLPDTEIHIASGGFMTHVTQVEFVNTQPVGSASRSIPAADGVTVTISGPDADKVYNTEGEKDFKITGGSLFLLLDPNIDFSEKESYTANISVTIPGYEAKTIPVSFNKEVNDGYVEVVMLDLNNLPQEVVKETVTQGTVDTTAGLSEKVVAKADNTATGGVSTQVTLPEKAIIKDENGATLTGDLEIAVTSFSETGVGTAFFPGGLDQTNIINKEGKEEAGSFVPAGFATIETKVGGRPAASIEGGNVEIEMTLSQGSINPKTGEPYKAGDEIDVFSYDESKGQWKYVQTGIVEAQSNTAARGTQNILTWFTIKIVNNPVNNLLNSILQNNVRPTISIGFVQPIIQNDPTCQTKSITVNWNALNSNDAVNCTFTVNRNRGVYFTHKVRVGKTNSIALPKTLTDGTYEIIIHNDDHNIALGTFTHQLAEIRGCGISINIDKPNPIKTQVTLQFQGKCGSTLVYPPVGTRVFYRQIPASTLEDVWIPFYTVTVNNKFDTSIKTDKVKVGSNYEFKVVYNTKEDKKIIPTITPGTNPIEADIPDEVCKALTK